MATLTTLCLLALGQAAPDPSFEERKLATIPRQADLPRLTVFGSDGKSVSYVAKVKDGWSLFSGDEQGEVFDDIKLFYDMDLHDASGIPYFGILQGQRFLLHQGKREGPYDPGKPNDYVYPIAAGGLHYIAQEAGKRSLVVDGKRGKAYDDLGGPYVSADGRRVAAVATDRRRGECVVVGDQEGEWFDEIHWGPRFSRDGQRMGYAARLGTKWFVVVDGKAGLPFDYVESPVFDREGKTYAYKANIGGRPTRLGAQGGRFFVIHGDRRSEEFDELRALQISPDGRAYFIATRNGKKRLVIGDQELAPHDELDLPAISRDGKRVAYPAMEDGRWFMILDAKNLGPVPEFGGGRCFNTDASSFAYVRREGGRSCVVVDGKAGPFHDDIHDLRFAPDGKRVAYWAKDEGKYVLVYGQKRSEPTDSFDYLPWFIRSDGTRVAYPARIGRELWWKVLRAE